MRPSRGASHDADTNQHLDQRGGGSVTSPSTYDVVSPAWPHPPFVVWAAPTLWSDVLGLNPSSRAGVTPVPGGPHGLALSPLLTAAGQGWVGKLQCLSQNVCIYTLHLGTQHHGYIYIYIYILNSCAEIYIHIYVSTGMHRTST